MTETWANGRANKAWYTGCEARDRLVRLADENGVDARNIHDDPQSVAEALLHMASGDDREWIASVFFG